MTAAAVPDDDAVLALHRRYAPNDTVLDLVLTHCRAVAEMAAWCADRLDGETVDRAVLRAACLLHDVGTYALFDDAGHVANTRMYPQHAVLGAKLLQDEGLDEGVWQAVETHVLLGLGRDEITGGGRRWPLPHRDYLPRTLEAEILCYADRFHSKRPQFNDPQRFLAGLEEQLPVQAERFRAAMARFGVPDVAGLAASYGHPVA